MSGVANTGDKEAIRAVTLVTQSNRCFPFKNPQNLFCFPLIDWQESITHVRVHESSNSPVGRTVETPSHVRICTDLAARIKKRKREINRKRKTIVRASLEHRRASSSLARRGGN